MPKEIVSIIVPIYNGGKWLDSCFNSILNQTILQTKTNGNSPSDNIELEIAVYDDASKDDTPELIVKWQKKFENIDVKVISLRNENFYPKGVGFARNAAISASNGTYLCFQDIDDEMLPNRVESQYVIAKYHHNAIIGSKFVRDPPNSTQRFTLWANNLSPDELTTQIYTSNGPTVIMPTWFFHRSVWSRIPNGFCEITPGIPEDLLFFYEHLNRGGNVMRSEKILLKYRYHSEATTFTVLEGTLWLVRMNYLIDTVLHRKPWCDGFTIWNAGKLGKRFFRDLPTILQNNVKQFCDIDPKKINRSYDYYDVRRHEVIRSIPIVRFSDAKAPLIICMKLGMTNGEFEANLASLKLIEGIDYILFT